MLLRKIHGIFPQTSRVSDASSTNPANMSKEPSVVMDLEDRDPNSLSQHLQVSWDEIFGEPMSIRSPECAWTFSHHCFRLTRNCCYTCLAVLCAPVTAFCLGITFACLSFEHIWCITPCLRVWKISCAATRNFMMAFTQALIIPLASSCGYYWSQIKVRTQKIAEDVDKKEDILLV